MVDVRRMIHREAWYREAQGEAEYRQLLEMWRRTRSVEDQPEEVKSQDPQLLEEDYRADLLEEILRLHRRLGKPPEEAVQFLSPLDTDWDWWDIVSKVPVELLPPVTFQVTFFIERYIDTDSSGGPGGGYVNQGGGIYGVGGDGEGESTPWTLTLPEFVRMMESQGWSSWASPSPLLAEQSLFDKDSPTLELDSRKNEDSKLEAFSRDLYHYRNNLIHHWQYSSWYDESEEALPESYLEEMGGWITTLQIRPPQGDTGYFEQVMMWAQELGAF